MNTINTAPVAILSPPEAPDDVGDAPPVLRVLPVLESLPDDVREDAWAAAAEAIAAASDTGAGPSLPATLSGCPEVIAYTEAGAPVWLMPLGDIVHDVPIPWLDADGNEVFE